MARDLPKPTPEGVLIRRVRESLRPRLPVAEAAKRAEVGEVTWGNTERGYKTKGRGLDPQPFSPSPKILAHMAYALGLTPSDLDGVGRSDAAAVLAEMRGGELEPEVMEAEIDRGRIWVTVPPDLPDGDREAIRRWAEEMAARLDRGRPRGGSQDS